MILFPYRSAPHYIKPILEEGIADGSIQAEHPKALAEAILRVALPLYLLRETGSSALSLCIALYSRGIFNRLQQGQQGDACRTHPAVEPVN